MYKKILCFYLALMSKQVQHMEKMNHVPPEIQPLLKEFKDIITDDILASLPPLRSISHQIDLILGSSLPNKGPYRMTPIESEEVNGLVQEFLNRGLI